MESDQTFEETGEIAARLHVLFVHSVNLFSFMVYWLIIELPEEAERKLCIFHSLISCLGHLTRNVFARKKALLLCHDRKKRCLMSSVIIPEMFYLI